MIARVLRWLQPQWGDNPLLEYEWLHPGASRTRRGFAWQLALILGLLGAAGLICFRVAEPSAGRLSITALVWQSLYFPVLALQTLTAIVAIALGAGSFSRRSQGTTWDHLRVTQSGTGLALRACWLSILYRLRAPIAAILLVRLLLALGMLFDLPAFGSHYLRMLGASAMTQSPGWQLSLVCLAIGAASAIMLPLACLALCAALGIVLSLALREGLFAIVGQSLLIMALVVCVCVLSLAVWLLRQDELPLPDVLRLAVFFGHGAASDWGLSLMQLGSLGEVWQRQPLGMNFGFGLSGLALVIALLADGMIRLAERLAERRER